MALEEYKRKRRFEETPEPPPKVETKPGSRFVVQMHDATRLHYDFRLEMEGVLKSWAVPKGPSLDPADKRLAMHVEDHPVSYFDFEGNIPENNYGAGSVIVWDVGTWTPLAPVPIQGKYVAGTEKDAAAMLAKGDLKFRLNGKRLKGDFGLIKMKGRRPGSKGTEWLLLKKHDEHVVEGYEIEGYDTSVVTGRTLEEVAGDAGSAEWKSRATGRGKLKAAWLADAIARVEKKKLTPGDTEEQKGKKVTLKDAKRAETSASRVSSVVKTPPATSPVKRLMPKAIHPMLAEVIEKPFDSDEWLFEIKWDGYRAIAFIEDGKVRLVSRNQNDLTPRYSELAEIPRYVQAKTAILDGEIVALDEEGRASFTLMQQRTGFRPGGRRVVAKTEVPVLYYAFDLLYLDGYDWRRVSLEERKRKLAMLLTPSEVVRYSDHYERNGTALFDMVKKKGLEGIVAKRRSSLYEERRSGEWLKLKIRHRTECVIGGYTEPEGSRAHFGSLVLGLYDDQARLVHVGQVGSGFDQKQIEAIWSLLKKRETKKNPFFGEVEALRKTLWVKPDQVAEIEFAEWTGGTAEGSGPKLRAPVFMGLRDDKDPRECLLDETMTS